MPARCHVYTYVLWTWLARGHMAAVGGGEAFPRRLFKQRCLFEQCIYTIKYGTLEIPNPHPHYEVKGQKRQTSDIIIHVPSLSIMHTSFYESRVISRQINLHPFITLWWIWSILTVLWIYQVVAMLKFLSQWKIPLEAWYTVRSSQLSVDNLPARLRLHFLNCPGHHGLVRHYLKPSTVSCFLSFRRGGTGSPHTIPAARAGDTYIFGACSVTVPTSAALLLVFLLIFLLVCMHTNFRRQNHVYCNKIS